MDQLCRLCSSQSPSLTPIFSIKNGRLLLDMITIVCPLKIEVSDKLPKSICSLCLRIVMDAVDLRERSILSDSSLRIRVYRPAEYPQDESIPKPSTFAAPVEDIKVEDEPMSVLHFIDESRTSHEDDQNYESEHELTDYDPPSKIQRISSDQTCSNCQCHIQSTTSNNELNEKIKEYFRKPLEKGGKWKCLVCQKDYAGHLNNLKEHLFIVHKDLAKMLGIYMKPRPRKNKFEKKRNSVVEDGTSD